MILPSQGNFMLAKHYSMSRGGCGKGLPGLDPRGFAPRRFSLTREVSNYSGPSRARRINLESIPTSRSAPAERGKYFCGRSEPASGIVAPGLPGSPLEFPDHRGVPEPLVLHDLPERGNIPFKLSDPRLSPHGSSRVAMQSARVKPGPRGRSASFYTFLLISIGFLLFGFKAEAGFIIQRPLYIGLTDGLVGYWSFDGPDVAGTTAFDRSGQGNTGTLTNGPVRAIGRIGQALEFDGVDDGVNVGSAAVLDDMRALSITAWIYPTGWGEDVRGRIYAKTGANSNNSTFFMVRNTATEIETLSFNIGYLTTNGSADPANNTISLNTWWFVAATFKEGDGGPRIWVNGREATYASRIAEAGTKGNDTSAAEIGTEGGATSFDGLIDDVRVYNRALNADEIKRLYKIGATAKINVSPKTGSLQDGLVGYWSFDGPDVAGVTAYDRSGQGNTGTLTSGPTRAIGRIGQALSFDGSDDLVSVSDSNSLDLTTDLTIGAWVRSKNLPATNVDRVVAKEDVGSVGTNSYGFGVLTSGKLRFTIFGVEDIDDTGSRTVSTNQWFHILVAHTGTSYKFYIDGVLNSDLTNTNNPTANALTLLIGRRGSDIGGHFEFFDGLIDDVRIYNRVLSPDEIKRLYKIGATFKINKPSNVGLGNGLVGYWTFDGPDMAGVTAYDRSGQNNTGLLTNGPTRAIGRIGQALEFDAVDDYVSSSVSGGGTTNTATLTAWIKADTRASYRAILEDGTNRKGLLLSGATGNPLTYFWENTADEYNATTGLTVNIGQWHFAAVVITPAAATVYLDGSSWTNTKTHDAKNLDVTWNMGRDSGFGGREWDGPIDEVRIYNRALSQDEIRRLYNMGR